MATIGARATAHRNWAKALADRHGDCAALTLVAGVVTTVAEALGLDDRTIRSIVAAGAVLPVSGDEIPTRLELVDGPQPLGGWADPWLPGLVHEQAVSADNRGARGAWYTPEPVVRGLVELAMPEDERPPGFAVDPTCGGGAFLLALLDRLVALGVEPAVAVTRVAGLDIDGGAVAVSRWSMLLWAAAQALNTETVHPDVTVGDALSGYPEHWPDLALVIGNPPFATPLRSGAVPAEVAAFREGREEVLGPYTDLAAMHLLAAVERSAPGSTVSLVQPQSVLAGRDGGAIRALCAQAAPLHGLWAAREPVFDAGVRACAPLLKPGTRRPDHVRLAAGPSVTPVPIGSAGIAEPGRPPSESDRSWAAFAALALGAPSLPPSLVVERGPAERLGSLATATAGFRDEYYGLVAACSEWRGEPGGEPNRLLTVGGIEPLASRWGVDRCRFGGAQWLRPWIDLSKLEPKVRAWTERRLEPKVVVATQSRLLEPVIDRAGMIVPATPLLAIHADPEDLALVAAVLLAPPVVAWAWQRWFGTALAVDALKLAARQVAELPLPADRDGWERAAGLLTEPEPTTVADGWARSQEVAAVMNRAYGADDAVLHWWRGRAKQR